MSTRLTDQSFAQKFRVASEQINQNAGDVNHVIPQSTGHNLLYVSLKWA